MSPFILSYSDVVVWNGLPNNIKLAGIVIDILVDMHRMAENVMQRYTKCKLYSTTKETHQSLFRAIMVN